MTAVKIEPRPVLVTGMARSGTTWVGRMLCASGEAAYLDEPFNLEPAQGAVRVAAKHWYEYVCDENEATFLSDLTRSLRFRYRSCASSSAAGAARTSATVLTPGERSARRADAAP
jgi:hypothetical protein